MTNDQVSKLEKLATYHATIAENQRTQAEVHANAKEAEMEAMYRTRQAKHLEAADLIRGAVRIIKVRTKQGAFVPPSLEAVEALMKEHGMPAAIAKDFLDHYESVGWVIGQGSKKMSCWKAAVRGTWKKKWMKDNQGAKPAANAEDPAGWKQFLERNEYVYAKFRTAPNYMQTQFNKETK